MIKYPKKTNNDYNIISYLHAFCFTAKSIIMYVRLKICVVWGNFSPLKIEYIPIYDFLYQNLSRISSLPLIYIFKQNNIKGF